MDARIDVHRILGLREGEAHVIRNAGGVVTDEVIRSLAISQHKLGTTEVIADRPHAMRPRGTRRRRARRAARRGGPGAAQLDDRSVRRRAPGAWPTGSPRSGTSPFLKPARSVRGFVYDVNTGALDEVMGLPRSCAVRGSGRLAAVERRRRSASALAAVAAHGRRRRTSAASGRPDARRSERSAGVPGSITQGTLEHEFFGGARGAWHASDVNRRRAGVAGAGQPAPRLRATGSSADAYDGGDPGGGRGPRRGGIARHRS